MTEGVADESALFERFNEAMGVGVVVDPYTAWAASRPAHVVPVEVPGLARRAEAFGSLGGTGSGELNVVTALSYDAVHEILRDGRRFSSSAYAGLIGDLMGRTIIEMDGPDHHAYRGLLQSVFSRRAMQQRWEAELVRPVVDGLIDQVLARSSGGNGTGGVGRAELVGEVTFPFPIRVIAAMLGLPPEQMGLFHRLTVELLSMGIDPARARQASAEIGVLLRPLIAERRARPRDDLLGVLVDATHDDQRLSDDEIVSFCRLLLPAGAETTYRASSNLLVGLLTHPTQLAAVRDDRALVPQAIEEGLRWEPPLLQMVVRIATGDTDVCGVAIPAGTVVVVNLGSANRDDRYWDEPDRFDIFRAQHPILSFGWGPHLCLGMHLARMEIRLVLESLLDRLPNLRVDPDAPAPVVTGRTFRSPTAIPVVW